ncbi:MAG TPA: hypothetical protein VEO53_12845 [Candidatus Binatia bacterium]|nr:hypothetical protein [Candidatus Binatia bacterium]
MTALLSDFGKAGAQLAFSSPLNAKGRAVTIINALEPRRLPRELRSEHRDGSVIKVLWGKKSGAGTRDRPLSAYLEFAFPDFDPPVNLAKSAR